MCLSRIIVKLNSELLSNTAPVNHLLHLDEHIRSKLSKFDGAAGIPIDWFYTARKDGGIQLQELSERQCALAIRLYVGMRESKGTRVRDVVKSSDVNFVVSSMSSWRDNLIVDVNCVTNNYSRCNNVMSADTHNIVFLLSYTEIWHCLSFSLSYHSRLSVQWLRLLGKKSELIEQPHGLIAPGHGST